MALTPLKKFVEENQLGFTLSSIKHLIRTDPSIHKAIKRISPRALFVDEEALEEWIGDKKFYTVKLDRKKPKP